MKPQSALVVPFLRSPIFQGLSTAQLEAVARACEKMTKSAGQAIVTKGAVGDAAYLIVSGGARIVRDEFSAEERATLTPGTLIGEMAMLIETAYGATVVALEPVRLFKIGRPALHQLMCEDRGITEHFLSKINARLVEFTSALHRIGSDLNFGRTRQDAAPPLNPLRLFPEPVPQMP